MQRAVFLCLDDNAMVLCSLRIHPHLVLQHDFDLWQTPGRTEASHLLQCRQHEELVSHDCGSRIAGKREDGLSLAFGAVVGLDGDSSEGGGLARLHQDAAKVNRAAEGAFDGGFEEVKLAHTYAAARDDDVDCTESVT